jgi:alpha-ketoglutarate-dependent dioxygenase alkB family protein 2
MDVEFRCEPPAPPCPLVFPPTPPPSARLHTNKSHLADLNLTYYKHFASQSQANRLFVKLENEIDYLPPENSCIEIYGKSFRIPRQHVAFGDKGLVYRFSGLTLPTKPWTETLRNVKEYVESILDEKFNYVLINRYATGQQYIAHHADNEKSLDKLAPIATISLGAVRHLNFRHIKDHNKTMTLTLEHGSMVVLNFPTNLHYHHSILKKPEIIQPRISLTFRRMYI